MSKSLVVSLNFARQWSSWGEVEVAITVHRHPHWEPSSHRI